MGTALARMSPKFGVCFYQTFPLLSVLTAKNKLLCNLIRRWTESYDTSISVKETLLILPPGPLPLPREALESEGSESTSRGHAGPEPRTRRWRFTAT